MSTKNNALLIILGIFTVIGGIWCVATPGLTYMSLVWVAGFMMFFHAIQDIVTYGKRKSMGMADGWSLAGAILACLCGFMIIISGKVELLTGVTMLYILFGWLIAAGIISIFGAFRVRKHTDTGIQSIDNYTGKWWMGVLLGILLIISGCLGFAHPLLAAISIGFIVGIEIITAGVNMLVRGFAS